MQAGTYLYETGLRLSASQALFWYQFCAFVTYSGPAIVRRALPHSLGASRHRTFPQLNLHRARDRRIHGRLPSNGLVERAQRSVPNSNALPKRAVRRCAKGCRRHDLGQRSSEPSGSMGTVSGSVNQRGGPWLGRAN
jgi:hypothetical protein